MDFLANFLGSLLPFILLLGIIIAVHELGHYAAGRLSGAAVESFALGFGHSLFEHTDRFGTRWRVNWLPLGGFVKFLSKEDQDSRTTPILGKVYSDLSAWHRAMIALAGPFANFVLAIFIFSVLALVQGIEIRKPVEVVAVIDGQPAARAGIQPGDTIIAVDGRSVHTPSDVIGSTRFRAGDELVYKIQRGEKTLLIPVTPEQQKIVNTVLNQKENIGRIGLQMQGHGYEKPGLFRAVGYGISFTGNLIRMTHTVILRIVTLREPVEHLRGPVGIWDVSDRVTDLHMQSEENLLHKITGAALSLLFLAGLLSVGIGYFNLLPLPVLDGGHFMGCMIEIVSRRQISERLQQLGVTAGIAALGSFFILVTWQDLKRVGLFEFFGRFLS